MILEYLNVCIYNIFILYTQCVNVSLLINHYSSFAQNIFRMTLFRKVIICS